MTREIDQEQLGSSGVDPRLLHVVRRTQVRLRTLEALKSIARTLPWAGLILTPGVIAFRLGFVSQGALATICVLGIIVACGRSLMAYLSGPSILAATLRLDKEHALDGRLAAALSFSASLPNEGLSEEHSGYAAVVFDDALRMSEVSAAKAAPLHLPVGVIWGGVMLALALLLFFIPSAKTSVTSVAAVSEQDPEEESIWIDNDDAELLERSARSLNEVAESPEAKEAARRFNEIVLQVARGEIGQAEAFRLASELQADIQADAAQASEFEEALASRGEALSKRSITRKVGDALREGRFDDAADALRKLSERLSSQGKALSKKEMEELRASIEASTKRSESQRKKGDDEDSSLSSETQSLQKKRASLLKKKKEGSASQKELSELAKTERRLKQLSRERKRASAQKTLSDLDRQLAEAARQLQKEAKKSGQFLDQAADTLQEGASKQLTKKEKQALLKELQAMKERLRRQNKDGKQAERLRQFQERARGRQGQKSGEKKPGGDKLGGKGRAEAQLRMGPGGVPIPGSGQEGGEASSSGKKAGTSHDPAHSGEASGLPGAKTEDKSAVAQDLGEGQSASETILSVAEEGFDSGSYRKLYQEYHTVAEEVMEKEQIPAGRKAHVVRYFELIRPRGERPSSKEEK